MSNITLTITVSDVISVTTQYDLIKIYRSSMGADGDYVEVSTPASRIPLIGSIYEYQFVDAGGDAAFFYKTSFFNSDTEDESDLSAPVKGDLTGNYVCVQDLREEGFTSAQMPDARALMLIQLWEDFVDQFTGQWFNPRAARLELDGSGSYLLQLGVPIIRVDSLQINGSSMVLPTSQYVVYDGVENRQNPRIKIRSAASSESENFYQVVGGDLNGGTYNTLFGLGFNRGERNQVVTGLFGYVEKDGTAPLLIKYAVRKLISLNSAKMGFGQASTIAGPVVEEVTDRHKIRYSEKMLPTATLTGDPELDRILCRYRRPAIIAAPYGELV
jgi:hypothetical protein